MPPPFRLNSWAEVTLATIRGGKSIASGSGCAAHLVVMKRSLQDPPGRRIHICCSYAGS